MTDNCTILFVKEPRPGRVKTRLARHVGAEKAAELYNCFVLDILSTLDELPGQLRVFCYPESASGIIEKWLGEEYSYEAQVGSNLGERMENAFVQIFAEGFDKVVLIGSDSPDLPGELLTEAFDALDSNDAAVGPCRDGGYYLIGFSRKGFLPETFEDVPWSSSETLRLTLEVLKGYRRDICLLDEWDDVDTWQDAQRLLERCEDGRFGESCSTALVRLIGSAVDSEGSPK
jgi:rSAM/selenodomain-associated transferase 1